MRWKIFRRRLAHRAPRVTVRHSTPWALRWSLTALLFGFFGAFGMWAFDAGKGATGLDRKVSEEVIRLRSEVEELRSDRDKAQSIANTADSLLRAEKATQEKLAEQVKLLESENLSLKGDLGFFERLLPSSSGRSDDLSIRGLQADMPEAGQVRYQLLVMQPGRTRPDFTGRFELIVSGQLNGSPWSQTLTEGARNLHFKQYQRVEGMFTVPTQAVVKTVQVRVLDASGGQRATQAIKL